MRKYIVTGLVIAVLALIVMKDKILEVTFEKSVSYILGAQLEIDHMQVGVIRTYVELKGVRLYNPPGFPDRVLAELPAVYVNLGLLESLKGEMYLSEVDLDLKEFNVCKNSSGNVNVNSLKPIKNKDSGPEIQKEDKKLPDIKIGKLHLQAETLTFRDYSKGSSPVVRSYALKINEEYHDISDPYTLIRLVVARVLHNTAMANLVNIPWTGVQGLMKDAYKVTANIVTQTAPARRFLGETINSLGSLFSGMSSSASTTQTQD